MILTIILWVCMAINLCCIVLNARARKKLNSLISVYIGKVQRISDNENMFIEQTNSLHRQYRDLLDKAQPFKDTDNCKRGSWCEACAYGRSKTVCCHYLDEYWGHHDLSKTYTYCAKYSCPELVEREEI